jgi:prepilin-type N-terminal cleavage/methylation domain-containing protein
MKKSITQAQAPANVIPVSSRSRGFTLIELMVAMAVFVIIAGVAFSLFGKHEAYAMRQEGLSSVNIGLRNAISQMQMDLAGSGENLLANVHSVSVQPFYAGIIVQNNVPGTAPNCAPNQSNWSYPVPSACYDGLTIINPKICNGTASPVLTLSDNAGGENLSVSSIMFADDPNNPGNGTSLNFDQGCFQNGDEVLVVQPQNTTAQPQCPANYCMTVVTLTKNAQVAGNKIQLQHNPTGAGGTAANCPGATCTDPLGIIYNQYSSSGTNYTNALGAGFSNGAFIVDLGTGGTDISYAVQNNPADPADPQLIRCNTPLALCIAGAGQVLTDQVIGFKIGAALADGKTNGTDIASYFFNAAGYCNESINNADCNADPPPNNDPFDYSLIRALRVSLIARTKPSSNATLSQFTNGFDQGPYLVQQASVAVDIRNMSIPYFGN